ncbi:hypothetical protein [Accumulibacter sp.]|nr:hypothetical protein [Accumulibacter sp.]
MHTWVATKESDGERYTRLEVVGWGVRRGMDAVRIQHGRLTATGTAVRRR